MFDKALSCIRTAIQQHIFNQHLQFRFNLLVHLEHPGIHNAHVHTRRYGVIKKRGMNCLTDYIVPSKTERHIGNASAHLGMRQVGLDPTRGVDVVHCIVVVLFHPGGNGEDVRIEDNVFGWETDLVNKHPISAFADADLLLVGRGLALLVEGHHHYSGSILQHGSCITAKDGFAFFQRDRINNSFTLQTFESRLDDRPFRRVNHEGDFRDFGLAGQQLQKACHRGDAVNHAFIHADVENIGSVLNLLPGDAYGFFVFAGLDELRELGRTGHIGPLSDHDVDTCLLREWL